MSHQPEENIHYRPFNEVPNQIKQLIEYQNVHQPLVNIPPQPAIDFKQYHAQSHAQIQHHQPQPMQHQPQPLLHQQAAISRQQLTQPHIQVPVTQYSPKVQLNTVPQQPNYKGVQAVQAGLIRSPIPVHQPLEPNQYSPQYKTTYAPVQQIQPLQQNYNKIYQHQSNANHQRELPHYIKQLIHSQQTNQGGQKS